MAGYIGKNVQVASTSSTAEGRDLMEAQSVAEQRALLDVDSKAEVDANIARKIAADDYATPTTGGTLKVNISGSNLYITTNGADA